MNAYFSVIKLSFTAQGTAQRQVNKKHIEKGTLKISNQILFYPMVIYLLKQFWMYVCFGPLSIKLIAFNMIN